MWNAFEKKRPDLLQIMVCEIEMTEGGHDQDSRYKAWGEFVITLDAGSEAEAEDRVLDWMDRLDKDMDMMNGSVRATDLGTGYEPKGREQDGETSDNIRFRTPNSVLERAKQDGESSSTNADTEQGESRIKQPVGGEPPKSNSELETVAVRTRYENSPYGWTYTEDAEFGKDSSAEREELVRREDFEQYKAEVLEFILEILDIIEKPIDFKDRDDAIEFCREQAEERLESIEQKDAEGDSIGK